LLAAEKGMLIHINRNVAAGSARTFTCACLRALAGPVDLDQAAAGAPAF